MRDKKLPIGTLALLSVLLIALLGLGAIGLMRSFDHQSTQREQDLVRSGMTSRAADMAADLAPLSRPRAGSALPRSENERILGLLSDTDRFDAIFVTDGRGRLVAGCEAGQPVGSSRYDLFARETAPLVAAVKQRDGAAGTNAAAAGHANAIVTIRGVPYLVTATRTPAASGDHGVTLAAKQIDPRFLDRLAQRYLLRGLRMVPGLATGPEGSAQVPLAGPDGSIVATLLWQPRAESQALFARIAPGIAIITVLLIILSALLLRRTHRMAQGLIDSEARAAHLAYHDALTGLANRVNFGDQLARGLARLRRGDQPFSVLCIDLDRFKDINDTYGHAVGDELLREAARRMAAQCRSEDLLARLSGDEFAIIKFGGTPADSAALADRLCRALSQPFRCGDAHSHVGCSIGIAVAVSGSVHPAEILRQADIALYKAKASGKGRYCFFESEMDVAIRNRRLLERDLREALASGQLSLAYQPQVSLDGGITALEALLRWHHPERGDISPAHFVPIAEKSNLILELGLFALRRAFMDSHRWPGLKVAVNVSSAQLRDPAFIGKLRALVTECGINPARFDLELTEGILLGDEPDTQERLSTLSRMGFGLVLDDFGTGYSSLSYLNRYPISKIKIDRSFIANLGVEREADALVDAIIKLARALNLGVSAKGVETEAQFEQLRIAGCEEIQGFLFSEAVSREVIEAMLGGPSARTAATG